MQSKFRHIGLLYRCDYTSFTALVRSRYAQSLIAKTLILASCLAIEPVKIKKVAGSFLFLSGLTKARLPISSIQLKLNFRLNSILVDFIKLIKFNQLENVYDFFNWPVKFQFLRTISFYNFLIESVK